MQSLDKNKLNRTLTFLKLFKLSIFFNAYTILLFILFIAILCVNIFFILHKSTFLFILIIILSLILLQPIINLIGNTKHKISTYIILKKRNNLNFYEETFEKYMYAPCTRLIVKQVLKDTLNMKKYYILKRKYKKNIFKRNKQNVVVKLYENNKLVKIIEHK